MPDFLYRLPLPFSAAIIIASLCIYSLSGMAVTRYWIMPRFLEDDRELDFNSGMMQAVLVFYGLATALIAVSVWETHSQVSDSVSKSLSSWRLIAPLSEISGSMRDHIKSSAIN